MFNCVFVAYKNTVSLTCSVKSELVLINMKQVIWSIENLQAELQEVDTDDKHIQNSWPIALSLFLFLF